MTKVKYAIFYLIVFLSLYSCAFVGKKFKNAKATKDEDNLNTRNEYTDENYFNKEDVYDFETTDSKKNKESKASDNSESDNFIYVDDLEKINNLKNEGVLQKLQKIYSEEGLGSQELLQQIKKIISDALHIPLHEIHLHDLNMLMAKWRSINRARHNIRKMGIDEQYFEKIKKQGKESVESEDDLVVELPGEEVQKGAYIDVDYLIQLTK